jgi:DNA mismatch repair ATPase MutS
MVIKSVNTALLALMLGLATLITASEQPTIKSGPMSYPEIGALLGRSMSNSDQPSDKENTGNTNKNTLPTIKFTIGQKQENTNPPLLNPKKELSRKEKLSIVCSILHSQPAQSDTKMPSVAYNPLRNTIKELEIFCDQNNDSQDSLLSKMDRTKTTSGHVAFAKMFTEPTNDIKKLKNRQAWIKEMVNNKEAFSTVDSLITACSQKENGLLSLLKEKSSIENGAIQGLYIEKIIPFSKQLNESPLAINILGASNHPLGAALSLGMNAYNVIRLIERVVFRWVVGGTYSALKKTERDEKKETDESKKTALSNDIKELKNTIQKQQNFSKTNWLLPSINPTDIIFEPLYNLIKKFIPGIPDPNPIADLSPLPWASLAYIQMAESISMLLLSTNIIRNTIKNAQNSYAILQNMHNELSSVTTLLKAARELHNLAQKNDTAKNGLFMQELGIKQLEEKEQKVAALKQLIEHLKSETFRGNYSLFSNNGKILVAYKKFMEFKDDFAGLIQAVSEADACLSVAKLVKNQKDNKKTPYCFVDYIDQDTPYFKLQDFWHPRLDEEKTVTNTIELGNRQAPSVEQKIAIEQKTTPNTNGNGNGIVLTGANTGGKSTISKAVALNILLASTLGIAPAQTATMTPFTYIATSMNIADNTAGGNSLFKTEVLRAKNTLEDIKKLNKKQNREFAFIALDELFIGTDHTTGQKAACKFIQHLCSYPKALFTFATHYKKATELEKKTNGTCKNFKVEAFKDENGLIVRPFKLEPGINQSNIAAAILQEEIGGIDFLGE